MPLWEPADVDEEQESVCDEVLKELCPFQIFAHQELIRHRWL